MHAHLKVAMRHTVTKKYEKKSTSGIEKSFSMIDRVPTQNIQKSWYTIRILILHILKCV